MFTKSNYYAISKYYKKKLYLIETILNMTKNEKIYKNQTPSKFADLPILVCGLTKFVRFGEE